MQKDSLSRDPLVPSVKTGKKPKYYSTNSICHYDRSSSRSSSSGGCKHNDSKIHKTAKALKLEKEITELKLQIAELQKQCSIVEKKLALEHKKSTLAAEQKRIKKEAEKIEKNL